MTEAAASGAPPPRPRESATLPAALLQSIVDALPAAAFILAHRRIVAVNARALGPLGLTRDEVLTLDPFLLLPPEDRERFRQRHEQRLRGEQVPDEDEVRFLARGATTRPVRVRVARFAMAGPEGFLFLSVDERARRPSARMVRALVDAAVAVQNERTLGGIFGVARARLAELGLSVAFTENAAGRFRFLAPFDDAGPLALAADALRERHTSWIPLDAFAIVHSASRSAQGLLIEDLPALFAQLLGKPRAEVALQPDLRAVAAGIPVDGALAFTMMACAPGLDSTVASAFGLFARQLGAAIETTRRLDDLARSNRELMTVNHVARASATLASGLALKEAIERLALSVAIDSIALFRREDDQLVLAVQQGFPEAWVAEATRVHVDQGSPWGEAAATGQPVVFDLESGGEWRSSRRVPTPAGGVPILSSLAPLSSGPRGALAPGWADSIAVPLRVSDDVNGVLVASRPGTPLTHDDLRLLTTVAAQLAVSLQNTLLFQQTQRRITELSLLLELGQAVSSSLDTREVLTAGAGVTARVLRCSAAWVLLPDATRTTLISAAVADALLGDRAPMIIPLERPSLSALAFQSGKPATSLDAASDPRVDPELAAIFGCRATLAVPLLSHDRTLGVLLLIERSGERFFDEQDQRLASHAAQLLAASIENADLFARERQRAHEMELLNEVSRSLAGSLEVQPLLDTAAETLRKLLDARHCYLELWDPKERALRCYAGPLEHRAFWSQQVLREGEPSLALLALRERRAVQVTNAPGSPLVSQRMTAALDLRTLLAVPMLARDEVLGVILIDDTRTRVFTQAEVERATAVAGQVALAVLSARLYEDLRRSYAELARTQTELVGRERLAALGELSASIAHEVRNPLGVIFNSLHGLRRLLKPDGDVKFLLDVVGEESDRLNRMVGDLLDYSRPLQPALQPVLLRPLVRDALAAARPGMQAAAQGGPTSAQGEVDIKLQIPEELNLRADQRLLRQALINLFLNAFQAMPRGGGVLRVSASRFEEQGRTWARIVIADSGAGIPADARARIFEPFFTTKATGTGLGLAVVKRIVDGHGGSIRLQPRDRGAEFHLTLPLEGEA